MSRTRKVLGAILIVLVVAVGSLAFLMSHDAACDPAPALPAGATSMKAIVYRCYGSPEVLELEDVEKPAARDDEILVKVRAAAINPLDWHYMRGEPYIMRIDAGFGAPTNPRLGVDFAGTVEAVGKDVKQFKVGDAVFGARNGSLAEYVRVRADRNVLLKPDNVSFEQAAAVPVAAISALQALRDKGKIKAGQKVLINGASGGVGTFAVQIARSFGAEVTGVCSTRNVEMVQSLGADHVIDYTKEDFTQGTQRYDLILDNVGNHPLLAYRRVMNPDASLVIVGGPDGAWLGPMIGPIKAAFLSPFVSQSFGMMLSELNPQDLIVLRDLMQAGKLTSVIDRRYPLNEAAEAIRYLEDGHARGKVIISLE